MVDSSSLARSKEDSRGIEPSWDVMYQRLLILKETTGSASLPQNFVHDPPLYSWIMEQRRLYKKARENKSVDVNGDEMDEQWSKYEKKLTFERFLKLEEIGFVWEFPHDSEWKKRYGELKSYLDKHGHCRVPARDKQYPELGRWVMTQRRQYALLKQNKKSRMSKERMRLLEHIGFDWVLREGKIHGIRFRLYMTIL